MAEVLTLHKLYILIILLVAIFLVFKDEFQDPMFRTLFLAAVIFLAIVVFIFKKKEKKKKKW